MYSRTESSAHGMLFDHIRKVIFPEPRVATMVELTDKLIDFMSTIGVTVVRNHAKKFIRRRIKGEFAGDKGKLLVMPDNLTVQMLATEYMKVKNEHDTFSQTHKDSSSHTLKKVA